VHQQLADPTFGLDQHASAMLDLLSTIEPTFAEFEQQAKLFDVCIQTSVYVKGENRWLALTLYPQLAPTGISKVMVFGEDALTDDIYVEDWAPSHRDSAPAPMDFHTFTARRFHRDDRDEAVNFIWEQLTMAYRAMRVTRSVVHALET